VAPVTTSLSIGLLDAAQVATVLASGGRDYQLDARLHFSTSVGQLDVDVHKTGTLAF